MPTVTQWTVIRDTLGDAKAIAWDGCHKIYVLMDDEQVEQMRSYDYDPLLMVSNLGVVKALEILRDWYAESCALRFISSVRTAHNPNDGFKDLIPQFDEEV